MWSPAATYLNTASYGLPPRPAWDALQIALEDWHGGRTSWEHWGIPGEEARASFATLVGVPVEISPPRRNDSPRSRRRAGRGDRAGRGRRRVQRRPDGDGRGRRSRRHRRGSHGARRDGGRRRDPGSRLVATRRKPLRRRRCTRLQGVDVAARNGVHDDLARSARHGRPAVGRWYAGEDLPKTFFGGPLRLAASAATRHVSRLVHVGGDDTQADVERALDVVSS